MKGQGRPAVTGLNDHGLVFALSLSEFKPKPFEEAKFAGDELTPAILRLIKYSLGCGCNVVLLSRRNIVKGYINYTSYITNNKYLDGLTRFEEHIRSFFSYEDRGKITVSTTHKYKGLENDIVIIMDADKGSYPLIHPNWEFLRIFGDSLEDICAEERRLFYVALTRATKQLFIIYSSSTEKSTFLEDIEFNLQLSQNTWDDFEPMNAFNSRALDVRIYNAYEVREHLKNLGFRFNFNQGKCWYRIYDAKTFDFANMCKQKWAQGKVRIQVYDEEGQLLYNKQPE